MLHASKAKRVKFFFIIEGALRHQMVIGLMRYSPLGSSLHDENKTRAIFLGIVRFVRAAVTKRYSGSFRFYLRGEEIE